MKKFLTLILLCAAAQIAWAQTVVTTDAEIRAAIQNDGVTIRVDADIDLSNSTLSIPSNHSVSIDLNGHKLDRKLTQRGQGGGQVITVRSGATLNLSNGTLTGGWGGGGGALVNEGGTVTLIDVIITKNVADDRGGGICNCEGGTLTMTGGAITNNRSNDHSGAKGGGGFFNEENATATLTNVSITGNEAKVCGGGGICNFGTLTLDGCTIQNNKAATQGGGIWQEGTLNVQGVNIVTGNTTVDNKPNNLFLKTGALLTVTGSLAGSSIGIKMETAGTFTSGYNTHNSGTDAATIFTSDETEVLVLASGDEAGMAVHYIERSWNRPDKQVVNTTKTLTRLIGYHNAPEEGDYKLVTNSNNDEDWFQLGGYNGDNDEYYVVRGNVSNNTLNVLGKNVHLILCDGAKLTLSGGILCYGDNKTLYIHSQSYGGSMGKLDIASGYKAKAAGIGSDEGNGDYGNRPAADLEIHGGKLTVKGGAEASGIGGGYCQPAGNITIYGGDIKALAGEGDFFYEGGSGIGGTHHGGGHLIIYDGKVYAQGDALSPGIGAGRYVHNDLNEHLLTWPNGWEDEDLNSQRTQAVTIIEIYGGEVEAHGGKNAAGIGGGEDSNGAILKIFGGDIKAYGGDDAAGIGGGWNGEGGRTVIHGGTVKAYGAGNGAGIGSGSEKVSNYYAYGGVLDVSGGEVYAYGGVDAAGIGGGEDADGGYFRITGGYVYAEGKDRGAGIGGGQNSKGSDVTIMGGTLVARAGRDETGYRAIGPGEGCDDYGKLAIGDNMMVSSERKAAAVERKNMCWYRTRVRVEVCDHSDVTYTIDGTDLHDHHISHCPYCLHSDTAEHTFDANGVCTVCGVHATAYAAKLYMPVAQPDGSFDGQTYGLTNTHLVVPDSVYRLPMATLNVPGLTFIGWEATTVPTEDSYSSPYTTATADTLYRAGNKYTVTGNICFVARYRVADVTLYDDEQNGVTLNEYNGMKVNKVILSGRVFNKNNTWQSITLPFSLSADELAASPLSGCTLKELDTDKSYNDTENKLVYLYFKDTTAIEAGVPYIIRWTEGNPILSPEFENVTLTNKTADARARLLMYKSLYSPQTFTSANKMVLYFNDNGVLVHPNGQEPVTVGAFRAYFRLTNLMGSDPDADFTITSNIDLPQGIDNVSAKSGGSAKIIRNGMLFIERNGRIYDATGQMIK